MLAERIYNIFHYSPSPELLALCESVHRDSEALRNHMQSLDPIPLAYAQKSYASDFLARYTYNSSAIEGSTLTLLETQLVIEGEYLAPTLEKQRDMWAARGIVEGYHWAQRALSNGRQFDEEFIKDTHARTALDLHESARGTYRTLGVRIAGSEVYPPSPQEVYDLMPYLIDQYQHSSQHQIIKNSLFHAMFENIHPFVDGNGRVGRTILNVTLEQAGYPAIALKHSHREEYLQTLSQAQTKLDPVAFIELIASEISNELTIQRRLLQATIHQQVIDSKGALRAEINRRATTHIGDDVHQDLSRHERQR